MKLLVLVYVDMFGMLMSQLPSHFRFRTEKIVLKHGEHAFITEGCNETMAVAEFSLCILKIHLWKILAFFHC